MLLLVWISSMTLIFSSGVLDDLDMHFDHLGETYANKVQFIIEDFYKIGTSRFREHRCSGMASRVNLLSTLGCAMRNGNHVFQ